MNGGGLDDGRDRSAWFGAQCGGSAWLLVGGGLLLTTTPVLGGVYLGLFLLTNVIGYALWRRRRRRGMFWSLETLLSVLGVTTLVALVVADAMGQFPALWQFSGLDTDGPGRLTYLILLIFPVLAVAIALRYRRS